MHYSVKGFSVVDETEVNILLGSGMGASISPRLFSAISGLSRI